MKGLISVTEVNGDTENIKQVFELFDECLLLEAQVCASNDPAWIRQRIEDLKSRCYIAYLSKEASRSLGEVHDRLDLLIEFDQNIRFITN